MILKTKLFDEVEIADDRIIHFPGGIVGFPGLTDFALIHDIERESSSSINWLQSVHEAAFAMPVIDPLHVAPDYDPQVDDELLKPLGKPEEAEYLVLVTITVPSDLTKMTVNLKAPLIINVVTKRASQIIIEGDKFSVRYPVYDILKEGRERTGE